MSTPPAVSADTPRAPALPLRIGLVGAGGWATEHAKAWNALPGITVTGVCDRVVERAQKLASDLHLDARVYSAADEMAASEPFDIVSIVNDERERSDAAFPFIAAGANLLIEKPIAVDLATADEITRAATDSGLVVMPGHVLRFDVRFSTVKECIDRNELGAVRSVYSRRLIPRSRYDLYDRTHPALMAAIHDYDVACWLIGDEPIAVTAYGSREAPGMRWPDLMWTVLQFRGGAVAVVETSFALPDQAGTWLESETEVIGSSGVARVALPAESLSFWTPGGQLHPETALTAFPLGLAHGALKDELSYLALCVLGRQRPTRVTMQDGRRSVEVALAAIESLDSGAPVTPRSASR
jgi:myo-inositol 2-dehydrogenase/D-chiro-inositol 1-dehydrogenase